MERLEGDALARALPDVARLRIEVFRDWPYLYDGDMDYEEAYLQVYREAVDYVLVVAFDGDDLVGVSTGAPMAGHADEFGAAFSDRHPPLTEIFYCAESVLRAQFRGKGIGHRFFDLREDHARSLGLRYSAFCAVTRAPDHPMRPVAYQPLDAFWRKRGYAPVAGAVAQFSWKDLNQPQETLHDLQVWMRRL